MSGRYLTDLAAVCRGAGLQVVELDGWQTRARSSGGYPDGGPWCVMLHHTASAGNGANDANYCTYGSSSRPVCNLVLGRDGVVYVCAAGATNTNGKGGPWRLTNGRTVAADSMNTRAIGIEMSNNGVGMAYPAVMVDAMFALVIALAGAYLGGDVTLVCQHTDWAPGRKIDPATGAAVDGSCGWTPRTTNSSGSWELGSVVAELQRRSSSAPRPPDPGPEPEPEPTPEEDDDVRLYLVLDPTNGQAQYVTDMATFRTPIPSPGVAAEGVQMFGWLPFRADTADPYPLGAGWAPFFDTLPITSP